METISKQDLEKIKRMEGQTVGLSLKTDREFVLEKEGKSGLKKVEKKMAELGYPLKYEEIEKYQWYPVQLDPLFLLVTQRTFGWGDETMWEWGCWGAKTHFIARLMIRYFVSKKMLEKSTGKFWRKYYTKGTVDLKFNGKSGLLVIKDFLDHPIHNRYLEGYFYQIASLVLPPEKLKVEEIETREEDLHKFKITW